MASGKHCYDYARPAVTVDAIVFSISEGSEPKVLLIRRKSDPFAGRWALPGGFVDPGETLEDAVRRELQEETGLAPERFTQFHTYGDPGRDPRGWTITVAYIAVMHSGEGKASAGSDAQEAGWFALTKLPGLAFDHDRIIPAAYKRLSDAESRF